jgi:hypothetical protein
MNVKKSEAPHWRGFFNQPVIGYSCAGDPLGGRIEMTLVVSVVHLGWQFEPFVVFSRPETAENTRFWKYPPKLGRPGRAVPNASGLLSKYYELVCQLSSITCPQPTEQRQTGRNKN